MAKKRAVPRSKKNLPLSGVQVLDLSRVLAGPYCGQLLADLGATVIKIERPGRGDDTRSWGPPFVDGISAYFMSCNRNKMSLAIDLESAYGQEVIRKMLKTTDVLIENFLPHSLKKMGLDAKTLRKKFPDLIICSISGFGRGSSWAERAGYDFAIQAMSGLMSVTGPPGGEPHKVGVAVTDVLTGLYAATGILAHLRAPRAREKRRGVHLEFSLLDAAVASQVNLLQSYLVTHKEPGLQGNRHQQIAPYEMFKTKNGHLVVCVGNDGQWQRFAIAVGRKDWLEVKEFATNPRRVAHRDRLSFEIQEALITKTSAFWDRKLTQHQVPCSRLNRYRDLLNLNIAEERGWFGNLHLGNNQYCRSLASPFHADTWKRQDAHIAPVPGYDNELVLKKYAGLKAKQIAALKDQGVIL